MTLIFDDGDNFLGAIPAKYSDNCIFLGRINYSGTFSGLDDTGPDWFFFGSDHGADGPPVGSIMKSTDGGGITLDNAAIESWVNTPEIRTIGEHLQLNPDSGAGYDIIWDGDSDLVSDNHVSGNSGILLQIIFWSDRCLHRAIQRALRGSPYCSTENAVNGASVMTEGVTQCCAPSRSRLLGLRLRSMWRTMKGLTALMSSKSMMTLGFANETLQTL